MNKFYFLLVLVFILSCSKDDKVSKKIPPNDFCGYGVIKFSKSFTGTERYMTFYPISQSNSPDANYANKINIKVYYGIIIRGRNYTKLWQDLFIANTLSPDQYGYYKSLIFLDLSKNTIKYDYSRKIPNEVTINGVSFDTKVFDYIPTNDELIKISNYKIFQSLR